MKVVFQSETIGIYSDLEDDDDEPTVSFEGRCRFCEKALFLRLIDARDDWSAADFMEMATADSTIECECPAAQEARRASSTKVPS